MRDFWPTISQRGGLVAFQRGKASLETGIDLFDAQIDLVSLPSSGNGAERLVAGDGYGPLISGDGKWLAYLKKSRDSVGQELWVAELGSLRRRCLCKRLQPERFQTFPMDQRPVSMIWSEDRPHLYFVAKSESGGSTLQRFRVDSEDLETILSEMDQRATLRNPRPSRNGQYLSYVLRSGDSEQLQVRHLPSGNERTLFPGSDADSLFCAGWLRDGRSMIIAVRTSGDNRGAGPVEIHRADRSGRTQYLAGADRAYFRTLRLDPQDRELYLIKVDGLAHNLYALSLADNAWRPLTDNRFPGITYAGLATAPNGQLLYSRHESGTDISMIRFKRQIDSPNGKP